MPSWNDLRRFLDRDGWYLSKSTKHHLYYEKQMPDGTVKRTRVSHSSGEIPRKVWHEILKKQLQVSKEYFNKMI